MVEVEIGQRLADLVTSSIIPIVYYEVRHRTNHKPHMKALESRVKELEKRLEEKQ